MEAPSEFRLNSSVDRHCYSSALGTGHLKLNTRVGDRSVDIQLKHTLYAPKIAFTLISIGRCNDAGYCTEFSHQKCVIRRANGKTLLQAPKLHGLYRLDNKLVKNQTYQSLTAFEVHKNWGIYLIMP